MVTTGGSISVISPLPVRLPSATPPSPVAVSVGALPVDEAGDGHRHRVVVVSSDSAVSSTVADVAEPPALPVKVTVDPESATPVGLPDSDSVKSVPSAPPARTPADPPGSPPRTAHGPGQHQLRRVAPTPSVAVVSGVVRTTVVGSSSITVNEADDGSPTV